MMRTLLAIGILLAAGTPPASANAKQGILILAPSGTAEWHAAVKQLAAKVDAQKPTELTFGTPTHATIEAAVERLAKRGAAKVTAVPFFLSTALSPELETGYPVPVRLASSPANDPFLAEVMLGRAQEISRSPSDELILLVGYGADGDGTPWSVNLAPSAQRMNRLRRFGSILLIQRPDAQTATEQLQVRNSLKRLANPQGRILVVSLLTLPSGGDPNIDQYLQGHAHEVAKTGVIADARIVEWLVSRTAAQSREAIAY